MYHIFGLFRLSPEKKIKYTIYFTYSELTTCEGIKKNKYTIYIYISICHLAYSELAASPAFVRCSRRRPLHATPPPNLPFVTLQGSKETYLSSHNPINKLCLFKMMMMMMMMMMMIVVDRRGGRKAVDRLATLCAWQTLIHGCARQDGRIDHSH